MQYSIDSGDQWESYKASYRYMAYLDQLTCVQHQPITDYTINFFSNKLKIQ